MNTSGLLRILTILKIRRWFISVNGSPKVEAFDTRQLANAVTRPRRQQERSVGKRDE
jgi:hypothetical protein